MKLQSFNEHRKENELNEYWGGPLIDLMAPRVDDMIKYLMDYKDSLTNEAGVYSEDTRKIESMWNTMNGVPAEAMAADNRTAQKIRGNGESLGQRIKRTVRDF